MGLQEDMEAEDARYMTELIGYCREAVGDLDQNIVDRIAEESKARQRALFVKYWPVHTPPSPQGICRA